MRANLRNLRRHLIAKEGRSANSGPPLPLASIHPSAWNKNSRKFAKKVPNLAHLSDAPTSTKVYAAIVTWGTQPRVKAQHRSLPST